MAADDYVYPGTQVLRNKFGILDEAQLEQVERRVTSARIRQPLPQISMTPEGYRAIHQHIFQDVYPWAGHYRTCEIRKSAWFDTPTDIDNNMARQFAALNAEDNLRGLSPHAFARRAAELLCQLNNIHPFRDGNGRTNRAFAQELARQAGLRLRLRAISEKQWLDASLDGFHNRQFERMAVVLSQAIAGRVRQRERDRDC